MIKAYEELGNVLAEAHRDAVAGLGTAEAEANASFFEFISEMNQYLKRRRSYAKRHFGDIVYSTFILL